MTSEWPWPLTDQNYQNVEQILIPGAHIFVHFALWAAVPDTTVTELPQIANARMIQQWPWKLNGQNYVYTEHLPTGPTSLLVLLCEQPFLR